VLLVKKVSLEPCKCKYVPITVLTGYACAITTSKLLCDSCVAQCTTERHLAGGKIKSTAGDADEERPVCVLCPKTLAADGMKSNKWKRHVATLPPTRVNKPLEFFQSNLGEYRMQAKTVVKVATADQLPDIIWAETGELCGFLHRWRQTMKGKRNAGADQEGLFKCVMDTLCHTQKH